MTRLANRTARLRKLEELLLLSPDGLSASYLADRFEVDRRTIYRDIDFLSSQGVPLWQEAGRYGLDRTNYLAPIRLTYLESMSLVLAGLQLARTLDERNPHAIAALRRLASTLPEFPSAHLQLAAERLESRRPNPAQTAVLETILIGWGDGRKVKVGYRSPSSGTLRERIIAPYAIEPTAAGLYVIGHDDWADDIRTFKLDRLEGARLLEERYTIPEDFTPQVYLADSWGIMTGEGTSEVILRFTPSARSLATERHWHPTQQIESTPDGGCLLRFRVSQPVEMQPWIRSWGAQVEVLAPAWLRDRIALDLQEAASQYASHLPLTMAHEIQYT
ncbi:MAG TPA: transcriptional regulator [Anaerolineales bacterium]|nr:transcriptional regulator [Anaerolineales bacterium]